MFESICIVIFSFTITDIERGISNPKCISFWAGIAPAALFPYLSNYLDKLSVYWRQGVICRWLQKSKITVNVTVNILPCFQGGGYIYYFHTKTKMWDVGNKSHTFVKSVTGCLFLRFSFSFPLNNFTINGRLSSLGAL